MPSGPPDDERSFVERLKKGDEHAFRVLVSHYKRQVFNIAYRMLLDPEEANDVSQDVFLAIYRTIEKFRGASKLSTWIHTIALNQTRNRLKALGRRGRGRHTPFEDGKELKASGGWRSTGECPPDKQAEGRELEQLIKATINNLDPEQREVLVLYDMNGLSYNDIVEATQLPIGTIKSRLHRARMTLAETVKQWKKGEAIESLAANHENKK
jgi:RNA polymerase sigma-70 factor (ECF subfamily)